MPEWRREARLAPGALGAARRPPVLATACACPGSPSRRPAAPPSECPLSWRCTAWKAWAGMRMPLRLPASAVGQAYARSTQTTGLRNLAWLIGCLALVAAPHLERLPPDPADGRDAVRLAPAAPPGGACCCRRAGPLGLTVGGVAGIFLSFGTILGRNPGGNAAGCWWRLLMELRTQRDAMLVVFLSYFVVITTPTPRASPWRSTCSGWCS